MVWLLTFDLITLYLILVLILKQRVISSILLVKLGITLFVVPLIIDLYYAKHGGVDEYSYVLMAKNHLLSEDIPKLQLGFSYGSRNFEIINAYILTIARPFLCNSSFFDTLLFLRIFHSLLGAIAIVLLWGVLKRLPYINRTPTQMLIVFIILSAPVLFWTSIGLKEAITVLYISYFFYILSLAMRKEHGIYSYLPVHLVLFSVISVYVVLVRPWIPAITFVALSLYTLLSKRVLMFILSVAIMFLSIKLMGKDITQLINIPSYIHEVTTGEDKSFPFLVFQGFIKLIQPLPWEVSNIFQAAKTLYAAIMLITVLRITSLNPRKIIKSIRELWNYPLFGTAFIYTIVWFSTIGATVSHNAGLYIREFSQAVPGVLIATLYIADNIRSKTS